jgi:hypothetical protein
MNIIPALRMLRQEDTGVRGQPRLHSETLPQKKKRRKPGIQWLTNIILATWEAEIGKTVVQGQSRQTV